MPIPVAVFVVDDPGTTSRVVKNNGLRSGAWWTTPRNPSYTPPRHTWDPIQEYHGRSKGEEGRGGERSVVGLWVPDGCPDRRDEGGQTDDTRTYTVRTGSKGIITTLHL